jgi:hypothetical protein
LDFFGRSFRGETLQLPQLAAFAEEAAAVVVMEAVVVA